MSQQSRTLATLADPVPISVTPVPGRSAAPFWPMRVVHAYGALRNVGKTLQDKQQKDFIL